MSQEFDWSRHPHRRFNALSGEWVLVSPHRTQRPWQGQVEKLPPASKPQYDPECYLCPGNPRAGGHRNPPYTDTFVFVNDFAALLPDVPEGEFIEGPLFRAEAEPGICKVVCFSPRHDLTLGGMTVPEIRTVIETWVSEHREIASKPFIGYVQIFENRGEMMGASNPHPHCQIWASRHLPNEVQKEQDSQLAYWKSHNATLLADYLDAELRHANRIVCENEGFVALVPFWAIWPFETVVVSRRAVATMEQLDSGERDALADILRRVTARYDNLFAVSFPYSMGFHQRPSDNEAHPEWHFHAHFMPPLLRSATVKKFMVGYELLGTPQRDITAESAAARLRELPETPLFER